MPDDPAKVTNLDIQRLHDMLWPPYGEGRRLANWLTKLDLRDIVHDWAAGRVSFADMTPETASA